MKIQVHIANLSDGESDYLMTCARIRGISCSRLIARMVKTACGDQMILAIMDDESRQPRKLPGESNVSKFRGRRKGNVHSQEHPTV